MTGRPHAAAAAAAASGSGSGVMDAQCGLLVRRPTDLFKLAAGVYPCCHEGNGCCRAAKRCCRDVGTSAVGSWTAR